MYLDYAATTPLDPRVFEAMQPHLQNTWGNPSSPHAIGREARNRLEQSRQTVADAFGVKINEVLFTASGTEATTLALRGVCTQWEVDHGKKGHIVSSQVEHKATLNTLKQLKQEGWNVILVPVDENGTVDVHAVTDTLTDDTAIVSLQWINNEVGTIQPIEEMASVCQERDIPFHCDALQAVGILPLPSVQPDLVSIAAHKFYGPKGIGALICREHVNLVPQLVGGGQEFDLRAGTENVPGAVGLAAALQFTIDEQNQSFDHLKALQNLLTEKLLELPGASLNGNNERSPHITNIHFDGVDGETLVIKLDQAGICTSTGSACTTGAADPSHVLIAMGRSEKEAKENVRFSIGKTTTEEEVLNVVSTLEEALK